MKKAFTLIELLIVIAIIGILASAVVLSIGGSTSTARDAKNTQILSGIRTVAQLQFATTIPNSYSDFCTKTAVDDFYDAVDEHMIAGNCKDREDYCGCKVNEDGDGFAVWFRNSVP